MVLHCKKKSFRGQLFRVVPTCSLMFQHVTAPNRLCSANENPSRCRSDLGIFICYCSAFRRSKKSISQIVSITSFMNHRRPTMFHAIIVRAAKQEAPDKLAACLGLACLFNFVPYLYLDFDIWYIYQHSPSLFQSFISALCIDVRFPCYIVEF
jgi:hypothetical protein